MFTMRQTGTIAVDGDFVSIVQELHRKSG